MIAEALENYYSGKKDKIRFNDYLEKDDDSGLENAPAIKYKVQKDKKYYLVIVPYSDNYGKFTVTIGCPHNKTHIENKTIKSCVEGGYTGVVKATTENNGYFEYVCKCGNTNKKEISKINSVSLSAEKYSYTGNSITLPTVTVKDADDKTISSEYYTVAYRNKATGTVVTEIKDEGTYEAVVTFNTLYDGEVVKEFTIAKESINPNPSDNNGTTTPSGNNTNISNGTDNATTSDKGNDTKITKPGKVTGVSAKANKKKSITIKWKKQKEVKGYQVRYALNKKMKKAKIKTIKNIKKAYVLKKAKAGKYYIQVRAYTVINGKKVFGKWSSKKVVKVSK